MLHVLKLSDCGNFSQEMLQMGVTSGGVTPPELFARRRFQPSVCHDWQRDHISSLVSVAIEN